MNKNSSRQRPSGAIHEKNQIKNRKQWLSRGVILLLWLGVWQCAALAVDNRILLAGPIEVLQRLGEELTKAEFYQSVQGSLLRIMAGFLLGLISGLILGSMAYRYRLLRSLLEPLIAVMRSIPVATFVVLVLIWIGSRQLAIPIAFLVVFPNIYVHTMNGLGQTDPELKQMAEVFRIPWYNRVWYLYRPALLPSLLSAAKISVGMGFKSGIAAEVIGLPAFSIGERLYMSKLYLDTAGVLAFTIVIILVSTLCEHLILLILRALGTVAVRPVQRHRAVKQQTAPEQEHPVLDLNGVSKSYDGKNVFLSKKLTIRQGECVGMMGASGCGKTTLFRLIMGLEAPDAGQIQCRGRIAAVFQEDRLCPREDAITNICMTGSITVSGEELKRQLCTLLPEDALGRPVSELSGGMRRRVAIARACYAEHELLIMDEPFTGMDEQTRRQCTEFILARNQGKTMLLTTHDRTDLELLGATIKNTGLF